MKKGILLFLVVFICLDVSGQNRKKDQEVEIINHEVQLGESVRLISKKYLVDPAEIYKLNKFAVDGVSQGMILRIPVPKKDEPVAQQEETRPDPEPVAEQPRETPIAEKPAAAKPTKKSEPIKQNTETVKTNPEPVIYERTSDTHTVVPKETLFSLARKYGVAVDDIKAANPELQNGGLKVGQVIQIPPAKNNGQSTTVVVTEKAAPEKKQTPKATPTTTEPVAAAPISPGSETITHVVAPKETLYSLSKRYNVTVDEIKQQNQALLNKGLQIGQTLTIKKQ
jgi:LysM repeat protein